MVYYSSMICASHHINIGHAMGERTNASHFNANQFKWKIISIVNHNEPEFNAKRTKKKIIYESTKWIASQRRKNRSNANCKMTMAHGTRHRANGKCKKNGKNTRCGHTLRKMYVQQVAEALPSDCRHCVVERFPNTALAQWGLKRRRYICVGLCAPYVLCTLVSFACRICFPLFCTTLWTYRVLNRVTFGVEFIPSNCCIKS